MDQEKIGKFIKEERKNKKLSQEELGELLGVSNRSISKWETGVSLPDISLFKSLCEVLDISYNELLSGERLNKTNYQERLEDNLSNVISYASKKDNKFNDALILLMVLSTFLSIYFINVNNKEDSLNTISKKTVKIILDRYNVNIQDYDIYINHDSKLPIGAGFGTSAAFALGISFTLPKLMGINISFKEAGEIAHLAEISQSSGLGDVISEMFGGCVIRLNEGSPVKGIIDKIPITKPIYVINPSNIFKRRSSIKLCPL